MSLKVSQNSRENACARVSFLKKLQAQSCNFIKKEALAQVFFWWTLWNFWEDLFMKHLRWLLLSCRTSLLFFVIITITSLIPKIISSVMFHEIMVKKSIAECRSHYHRETAVPVFSFPANHGDLKYQIIRFAEDWQPSRTLFVYINHFEEKFSKKWLKK